MADMNTANKLTYAGFNAPQTQGLIKAFSPKVDVPKIGIADAENNDDAIKLANACKARLNELIEALKG